MQCRHEILRHELLYAPSLFLSDPNYKLSYIGLKAQNIYQELETCLKIICKRFGRPTFCLAQGFETSLRGMNVWEFLHGAHYGVFPPG